MSMRHLTPTNFDSSHRGIQIKCPWMPSAGIGHYLRIVSGSESVNSIGLLVYLFLHEVLNLLIVKTSGGSY